MTRDDIIHMAKKAELHCHMNLTEHSLAIEDLEHFAALVRDNYNNKHSQLWQVCVEEVVEAEREACAKVCDEIVARYRHADDAAEMVAANWCAAGVRARGNT